MKPYEIVLKKLVKRGDGYALHTPEMPKDERTWTSMAAYAPGDIERIRKVAREAPTSFRADVIEAPGGAWVIAGHNDLERVIGALKGS